MVNVPTSDCGDLSMLTLSVPEDREVIEISSVREL